MLEILFHGVEASNKELSNKRWPCNTDAKMTLLVVHGKLQC